MGTPEFPFDEFGEPEDLSVGMSDGNKSSFEGNGVNKPQDKNNPENGESLEHKSRRELIDQMSERVRLMFDLAKERMIAFKKEFDDIYGYCQSTFSEISGRFEGVVKSDFLEGIDKKSGKLIDSCNKMLTIFDLSNEKMQDVLKLLVAESATMEQIEAVNKYVDGLIVMIDQREQEMGGELQIISGE